ncbi:DUF222 domain-containing protein [Microbacterium sp. NPDC057944]|uniref:HNH endonuclease signature motif containing protein n=1 Tax=Microbacterium sp. NPDC057944 TaxID=3346286 RepID=UPI0036DEAD0F
MSSTAGILDRVVTDLDLMLGADMLAGLSATERMDVLRGAGEALRRLEAIVVETAADADARELPDAFGCRSLNELLQRVLRVDAATAARMVKAASALRRELSLLTGERLPARWPALREAMLDGEVGVAGLLAATGPMEQAGDRIGAADRLRADAELADQARGIVREDDGRTTAVPPATPDDLRQYSQLIALYLDPDGSAPIEARASQRRSVVIGRLRDGAYPIRGALLPEVYAQLQLIFDAQLNPKVEGPADLGVMFRPSEELTGDARPDAEQRGDADPRTRAQKQHDALAAALGIAARHDDMPSLGGAAPTLVVHVDAAQISERESGGWATMPGVEAPVPASVAVHTACSGAVQRVLFDEGRIVGISTTDRVFTATQRRAIVLRDGECLIPGCHVPASWCEIHHVTEHARGGPTHTDNGVPLCWHHHRTLDRSGWEIRMSEGVPQIRGPGWWDPSREWREQRRPRRALTAVA